MNLPTTPIPATHISPKLLLIYGPPKVGKTTILSQLPGHLIIDTEDGTDYVTATKIKISDLRQLNEASEAIIKAERPYKYVCIDTIDVIEQWAEAHATFSYKESTLGKSFGGKSVLELPQGGGYFWLRKSFLKYFDLIMSLSQNIILVGHIRDKFLEVNGKEVVAKDLDLTGKIKSIVCSRSDAIAHVYRDKEDKFWFSFVTRDSVNCGTRCNHLKGKQFVFETWKEIYPDLP